MEGEKHYNEGHEHLGSGEYDEAIVSFTKAIELDPKNANFYGYRGDAYDGKNDYAKAVKDYTKAIELDSRDIRHNVRGFAYYPDCVKSS